MRFKSASFKVTASVLLLAASTGLAFAGHCQKPCDYKCETPCCPAPANLMDGFYLGAETGYNIVTADANFNEFQRIQISGNPHLSSTGWNAGLFAGYGKYFDVFYLGAEVWGNWSSASQSFTVAGPLGRVHHNVRSNWDWGIGVLPGIALNCATLAYARLGYEWANINSTGNIHINATNTNFSGSHTNTRSGFAYGLGIETQILCNWSVRADFTYINYNNNDSSNRIGSRIHPADNRYSIGVVYHFC